MDDSLRDIRQRLLKRKNELNLSYQDMSDKTGLSKSTLQRYITGDIGNLGLDKVELLAKALDVTPAYLMGWEEDTNIEQIEPINSIKIPVVGRIPAGTPIEAIEDIIEYIDIPENWTNGNKEYFGLIVRGDSMYPLLLDGDTVVIKRQEVAETGDICACYINGYDATLKRISLTEHSITLKPENPNYPPKTYTHPGEVTIAGKVIEVRRKI